MAVTENTANFFTEITPDGSSDWDCSESFPNGMRVWYILFYPSAANDVICLREGGKTGPRFFKAKDVDGRGLSLPLPGNVVFPYLDQDECTFDDASLVTITFYQV